MVHRIYICSDLISSFVVQRYDQVERWNRYNSVMSSPPSFVLKNRISHNKVSNVCYYLQHVLQLRSNRGLFCGYEWGYNEDIQQLDTK